MIGVLLWGANYNSMTKPINIFRIKENKIGQWKDWCTKLQTEYKEEALETMREEGIIWESFQLFKINNTFYTLGVDFSPNNSSRKEISEKNLNKIHQSKKKECLEFVSKTEILYDLIIEKNHGKH